MRRAFLALTALTTVAGCADRPTPGAPPPGVPRELATSRARYLSDVRYELRFEVPASRAEPIRGEARIRFGWTGRGRLVLDFAADSGAVEGLEANGELLDIQPVNEHLVVPRAARRRGQNSIRITFRAGDGSLNRSDDFLYALFVPDRARWAFPAFDQPDVKARFALTLDVPAAWTAVANGAEVEVSGHARPGEGERAVYRFAETEPIPTYLFSFAAGRFSVEEAERDGRRMRLYHRETDRSKVARNRQAIFDLHAAALAWLEDYTGIPYPFGKFDFVAIPSFQYGGMEHPGAIFYRAPSLFLDESATQGQRLGRASVIAHETAHMWFGNLVTMRWFDDVWMKEVFANFMAAKIVHPSFPELDHELRFLLAHYPAAYAVDRTEGANPIRQPLENLDEAGTLYGAIIYQKAPVVMRQLELLVGESALRDGLREYLDAHRFGNASWPDLVEVLDRRSALDLAAWSEAWVEEPGRPTVETLVESLGAASRVTFRQSDPRGRGLRWAQALRPWAGGPAGAGFAAPLRLESAEATATLDGAHRAILPNGDGVGYGLFRLTDASRAWLLDHLYEVEPVVPRAVAWLTMWDDLLEGGATPRRWLDMAHAAVAAESDELLLAHMLGDMGDAYWRFLDQAERAEVAPAVEGLLWRRMESAGRVSEKASLFGAYRALALSEEAIARLRRIWERGGGIRGLPLSESDLTGLAQDHALRTPDEAESILERQAARIEDPDRRARFEFVRPALAADPEVRRAFFATLADPANREREPWVLDALSFLNHPLRAADALPDLGAALDLLEEVQRTGDIFFPKRWLDAALSGHASPAAASTIRRFLADRPDLPPRLRGKLLQSSDPVFRAERLKHPESAERARASTGGASRD